MTNNINKVFCFFEQSGMFKNVWKKLGYCAEDYDIQNDYGETDHVIDLFAEIESAYSGGVSVFDKIGENDLIMAFFPCIYFESMQMTYYDNTCINLIKKQGKERYDVILERVNQRERFYILLYKLYAVCDIRHIPLIIENPATEPHYLLSFQNFPKPTFLDRNRALRGDYYTKPTAYWFLNLTPTHGQSYSVNKNPLRVKYAKKGKRAGICSAERSMISPTYAENFICDFILGKAKENTLPQLF